MTRYQILRRALTAGEARELDLALGSFRGDAHVHVWRYLDVEVNESPFVVLQQAFIWAATPQGTGYWTQISRELELREANPLAPHTQESRPDVECSEI